MSDHTALSTSQQHVRDALDLCLFGDRAIIPSGTVNWSVGAWAGASSSITVPAGVRLDGAGIGSTIIVDDTATDSPLIVLNGGAAPTVGRISNIEFRGGTASNSRGTIFINGNNLPARVDNCKFKDKFPWAITSEDCVGGCIDHCDFDRFGFSIGIYIFNKNWVGPNGSNGYAGGSWNDVTYWGDLDKCLTVEYNIFTVPNDQQQSAALDCYGGARIIFRRNTINNGFVSVHGTETSGEFRGGRSIEIYYNLFNTPVGAAEGFLNLRSGAAVVWGNIETVGGRVYNRAVRANNDRLVQGFTPYGIADGKNVWDQNIPGGPFDSGACTSAGTLTMTDNTKSWTVNEWFGHSLVNLETGEAAPIYSNTATTITFSANLGGVIFTDMEFTAADGYEIHKVNHVLDGCGMGACGYIADGVVPVPPVGWPDQALEPVHSWGNMNTADDVPANEIAGDYTEQFRSGVHYNAGTVLAGYPAPVEPHPLNDGSGTPPIVPPFAPADLVLTPFGP